MYPRDKHALVRNVYSIPKRKGKYIANMRNEAVKIMKFSKVKGVL